MGILEQLARKGFSVMDGKRRLLAQLGSDQAVFVKDTSGHSYLVRMADHLVTVKAVESDKVTAPSIALLGPAGETLTTVSPHLDSDSVKLHGQP